LFKANEQGIDYVSGMLLAIGLTAKTWGRIIADDPDMDFVEYMEDGECEVPDDGFAHHLVREGLRVTEVPQADKLRAEIREFFEAREGIVWGQMVVHYVNLLGELIRTVLEIRNGDTVPEGEDGDS